MKTIAAGIFLLAMLGAARDAAACSCVASAPACEAYWKTPVVFAGRVESVTRAASTLPARMAANRRVRLSVSQPFQGVSGKSIDVTTGAGGGDCGYPFREGAEYLVYAQRDDSSGELRVSVCSRTKELPQAADDLAYIRKIAAGEVVPARISGEVMLATRLLGPGPSREPRPLAGIGIRLDRDGRSTRVATGADGRFVAEGLSAGQYTASLELSEGLYADGWPRTIELRNASSCAEVHAIAFADGRVSGRVVDADGHPVAGLTIELTIPAGIDESPGPERLRDLTDSDGRYEIARIPAGRFVLGINTQPARDGGPGEPRLFHPGVPALATATRIALRAGERQALPDFVLPRDVRYVPLSGVVLDAGGAPAANALVYLKGLDAADYILSEPAVTDGSGRFTLAALAGRAYRVFAERSRGDGATTRLDSSEQVPFTAAAATPPFRLTLRRRY